MWFDSSKASILFFCGHWDLFLHKWSNLFIEPKKYCRGYVDSWSISLISYLKKALDQVWRWEVKKHIMPPNARYAILKRNKNRTEKRKAIFKRVQESNLEVRRAWKLKEGVQSLFESCSWNDTIQLHRSLDWECDSVKNPRNLYDAKRFQNHFQCLCHALCHPQFHAKADTWNVWI